MKTEQEIALMKQLWAPLVKYGRVMPPAPEWNYYGGDYGVDDSVRHCIHAYFQGEQPVFYYSEEAKNFGRKIYEAHKNSVSAKKVKDDLYSAYSLIIEAKNEHLSRGQKLLKEVKELGVDWEKTDLAVFYERNEFVGTNSPSKTVNVWEGELFLKNGESVQLYLQDDEYDSKIADAVTAIKQLRNGVKAEDLVKDVFGE